jgi:hypothetical protein
VIERTMTTTQAGTKQALQALGLSDEPMELHTAVAAIVRDPSRIARWRSGGPLLIPMK